MAKNKMRHSSILQKFIPWLGFLIASPFFVGACMLGLKESQLPHDLRMFVGPIILEARFFAIGFALSISAAFIAITSKSAHVRLASTGVILAGIAIIISGFITQRVIEQSMWNMKPSILSLITPSILYVYSFWLILTSINLKRIHNKKLMHQEMIIEEQPQPLSQL